MYTTRIVFSQPVRLAFTVAGIALCILLMMFLNGIYAGVSDGSVEYLRRNHTDLWVLQNHSTNILRGTSFLRKPHEEFIRQYPGVGVLSPVLLLLPTVSSAAGSGTVFLAGYNTRSGKGGPPVLSAGRSPEQPDEIVLDECFARKIGVGLADTVRIREKTLRVVGFSSGTNALVIQYAFVALETARELIGVPGLSTCYLLQVSDGYSRDTVAGNLRSDLPDLTFMTHEEFVQSNIREMKSGFLPVLFLVAALGSIVLTAILSLLLSMTILENRMDFAVMKALGSPGRLLFRGIVAQGMTIILMSALVALLLFFPVRWLVESLAPQVTAVFSASGYAGLVCVCFILGLASALISLQRLRRIYPMEAFI